MSLIFVCRDSETNLHRLAGCRGVAIKRVSSNRPLCMKLVSLIVFVGKVLYFLFYEFSDSVNKILAILTDDYNLTVSTDVCTIC